MKLSSSLSQYLSRRSYGIVKLQSLLLRLSALLLKMGFVFYIGKEMPSDNLGQYGLISVTLTFLTIIIGFDLYIETQRRAIASPSETKNIFLNHLIALSINYLIVVPFIWVANYYFIGIDEVFLFFLLLFGEHFGLEFFRLLVTVGRVRFANVYIFCKEALWIALLITKWMCFGISPNFIHDLLLFWGSGATISFFVGVLVFYRKYSFTSFNLDTYFFKSVYLVGFKYIFGSIAIKLIQFSDRYVLLYFLSLKEVGIYTFFNQLGNSISTMIFTLTVSFAYPKIIDSASKGDISRFKRYMHSFNKELMVIFIVVIFGFVLFLPFLLNFVQKNEFFEYQYLMYVLLSGILVFNLSFPFHFGLIGARRDLALASINVSGAFISFLFSLVGIFYFGIFGAGFAKLLSFSALYLVKRVVHNKAAVK